MKPKVYLTRTLPVAVMDLLNTETELLWNTEDRIATPGEIKEGLRGRDALLCTAPDCVGSDIMEASPNLKVIANFGVGFNNIDVAAATKRKIAVTNTPGVLTNATADLAMALLLATARRIGEGERLVRAKKWPGWGPLQLLGAEVSGATLGIIGLGRIGHAVAQRAKAFDMRLLYWNRTRLAEQQEAAARLEYSPIPEILRHADFISLHLAYLPETHHLIGEREFAQMKRSAILINTSRGAVVDEAALVNALREKRIAAAGLDVYENEPEIHPGLLNLENVVLSPHLGSSTLGTRTKMGMMAVTNLLAACSGQRPPNCINPQVYG